MKKVIITIFVATITTGIVSANECTKLIALSKVSAKKIENKSMFESHASSFCKEYQRSQRSQSQANYGASYKFLSASMGKSRGNTSEIASRYCSNDSGGTKKDSAYEEYIEHIQVGAYSAYKQCLKFSSKGIKFEIDQNTFDPVEMTIDVLYHTQDRDEFKNLTFKAKKGINCAWTKGEVNNEKPKAVKIESGRKGTLECTRSEAIKHKPGYIKISTNAADSSFSIRWPGYNDKDIPIDLVNDLRVKYQTLIEKNDTLLASLKDSVVAFDKENCPGGWYEYSKGYGRFIRGLDKSGLGIDAEKNRIIGSVQNDDFKNHNHLQRYRNVKGHFSSSGWEHVPHVNGGSTKGQSTTSSGGAETRPKNVALLYCIKE